MIRLLWDLFGDAVWTFCVVQASQLARESMVDNGPAVR